MPQLIYRQAHGLRPICCVLRLGVYWTVWNALCTKVVHADFMAILVGESLAMANTVGVRAAWTAVGAILFYFTMNAVVRAWQWPLALPGIGFEKTTDTYAAALIAVPCCLVLLGVVAILGAANAALVKRGGVLAKLPAPFGLGDPRSVLLHSFQIILFLVVPFVGAVALSRKFLTGQFCVRVEGSMQGCGITRVRALGNWSAHFRYVPFGNAIAAHNYVYQGGVDYWPVLDADVFLRSLGLCFNSPRLLRDKADPPPLILPPGTSCSS